MIGVHGPDFPGQPSVADGVKDYRQVYPVVDDAQKTVWQAYGITARPSWVLIGKDGTITQRGVGSATTPQVRSLIETALR